MFATFTLSWRRPCKSRIFLWCNAMCCAICIGIELDGNKLDMTFLHLLPRWQRSPVYLPSYCSRSSPCPNYCTNCIYNDNAMHNSLFEVWPWPSPMDVSWHLFFQLNWISYFMFVNSEMRICHKRLVRQHWIELYKEEHGMPFLSFPDYFASLQWPDLRSINKWKMDQ